MRLVIISNRVPTPSSGSSAGGLAVALLDALAESGGVWFGWNGETSERASEPDVVTEDGIDFVTVPLTRDDHDGYYKGYANSVLWPLFHDRLEKLDHRASFLDAYRDVNRYFAASVAPRLSSDDVVWVQDYHLIPLGAELRRREIRGALGFFLHTPFPPHEIFRALPGGTELLEDLFAYDLVGFQTRIDARNFADAVRWGLGARVDVSKGVARVGGRTVRFGAFPIGIDVADTARVAHENRVAPASRRLIEEVGERKLIIGADRLDYTKGLVRRLHAFDRFLDRYEDEFDDDVVYVQIAAPSRENVSEYRTMTRRLEAAAGHINGRQNRIDWTPLRLLRRSVPRDELLGYFSVADVGLVTPVRDGMNLVAKEFLTAQTEEDPGVLVLSSLAGAVDELAEAAVVVNPYDVDDVAEGIREALAMPVEERRARWKTGLERLERNTARTWRDRFLSALAAAGSDAPPSPPRPGLPRDTPRSGRTVGRSITSAARGISSGP